MRLHAAGKRNAVYGETDPLINCDGEIERQKWNQAGVYKGSVRIIAQEELRKYWRSGVFRDTRADRSTAARLVSSYVDPGRRLARVWPFPAGWKRTCRSEQRKGCWRWIWEVCSAKRFQSGSRRMAHLYALSGMAGCTGAQRCVPRNCRMRRTRNRRLTIRPLRRRSIDHSHFCAKALRTSDRMRQSVFCGKASGDEATSL